MTVILAIPIVPFLLFGSQMEAWAEEWRDQSQARSVTAAIVFGLLATDIFLPVPASAVSTIAGSQLGAFWGTVVSWAGMNTGSIAGFALARRYGQRFAVWFSKEKDISHTAAIAEKFGPITLVLTRGVPVLAEASVLMMGMHRLSWRRFLLPVLLSNLGLSLAYAVFGDIASQHQWLPIALGVAVALPVLFAAIALRWNVGEEKAN